MKLSAPIFRLKRRAKILSRQTGLALHTVLDQIARKEGFASWSHLSASCSTESPARSLIPQLQSGDLVLLGARPHQGKTRLGLELALRASDLGRKAFFFSLDYHDNDVADQVTSMGLDPRTALKSVMVDTSDDVSADHIVARLQTEQAPALVVADYLQILDQKRSNPGLNDQITTLRAFSQAHDVICIMISQIDRSFELSPKPIPSTSDIRLPNPLDLGLFDKFIFLQDGAMKMETAA